MIDSAQALHLVVALVFIQREDAVLLVKQDYGHQYWSLPGGVVEPGESVEQAAIREVKEETGLDIRITKVVGIYSKPNEHAIAITLEGTATGGTLAPNNEITECRYFKLDELPQARDHLQQRIADFANQSMTAFLRTEI
jgi:ADP-ribose pyrophosphatase YjhB (NUDIX family)